MTLPAILIFAGLSAALRFLKRGELRIWALFLASAAAVYWLQPTTPIRYLDYWLPTLTLALAGLSWVVTTPSEARPGRMNLVAAALLVGLALAVALTRYLGVTGVLGLARPPQTAQVVVLLAVVLLGGLALARFTKPGRLALTAAVVAIIVLFLVLKVPAFGSFASYNLRLLGGQSLELATFNDLRWLGFSYVAFRLIHTFRDRQTGRLPVVGLRDYVTYVVFFPAFTAGPIDRLEHFEPQLCQPPGPAAPDFLLGGRRLSIGLLKKFVLANSLALVALGPASATQVQSAGWMWLLVYAYALMIYFDFSGYTDIAIGIAMLAGIRLPENFDRPYLRPNLTQFWNNWHMTLTNWFRAYYFNPLTRSLRRKRVFSPVLIMLFGQITTMLLIGLWHGVSLNFVLWGLWHGLGTFAQNRYSEWARPRLAGLSGRPRLSSALHVASVLLTFNFVALGWVWFALPSLSLSWQVFLKLFGF